MSLDVWTDVCIWPLPTERCLLCISAREQPSAGKSRCTLYTRRQMDGSEHGHVSRELLRLMDQHLMGSRYSPPPPSPSLPTKKDYIHSGGRVGGYKAAAMSFDGEGIHRLHWDKISVLPKPFLCLDAVRGRECDSCRNGGVRTPCEVFKNRHKGDVETQNIMRKEFR